jgi:hypothetical protein
MTRHLATFIPTHHAFDGYGPDPCVPVPSAVASPDPECRSFAGDTVSRGISTYLKPGTRGRVSSPPLSARYDGLPGVAPGRLATGSARSPPVAGVARRSDRGRASPVPGGVAAGPLHVGAPGRLAGLTPVANGRPTISLRLPSVVTRAVGPNHGPGVSLPRRTLLTDSKHRG